MKQGKKSTISDRDHALATAIHPMHGDLYLARHWANRLPTHKLDSLTTPRLLAYYHKHIAKRNWFQNEDDYPWQENDQQYNAEFNMSPNKALNYYLDQVKDTLDKREHVSAPRPAPKRSTITPVDFFIVVNKNSVSACYDGKPYYTLKTHQPDEALMLKQSRVVQCHPMRDPNAGGIYFVNTEKRTIGHCFSEDDVPAGCLLYRNWILNKHVIYDKDKGITAL